MLRSPSPTATNLVLALIGSGPRSYATALVVLRRLPAIFAVPSLLPREKVSEFLGGEPQWTLAKPLRSTLQTSVLISGYNHGAGKGQLEP